MQQNAGLRKFVPPATSGARQIAARTDPGRHPYAFDLLELNGTDLRTEPIEVRATLASLLRNSRPGVRLNEHLEHPEGMVVFNGGHRLEAARITLSIGTLAGLAQVQEPGRIEFHRPQRA
jgi:hypothetical protein